MRPSRLRIATSLRSLTFPRPLYAGVAATLVAGSGGAAGCSSDSASAHATAEESARTSAALIHFGPQSQVDPLASGPGQFKLLIIAPQAFRAGLQPLIDHKNKTGMPTSVATIEDIQTNTALEDDAAKIKDLILSAVTDYGAQYVLLMGDGSFIPARSEYVRRLPGYVAPHDVEYYPTDLYYANLWTNHDPSSPLTTHGGFSTWDANGDGKYNDFYGPADFLPPPGYDILAYNPDNVDAFPDVSLGRVEAHNTNDVTNYVNKVIAYETGMVQSASLRFTFVADGGYGGASDIAEQMQSNLPPAWSALTDRISFNTGTSGPPSGWTAGSPATIASDFGVARWLTYVGHSNAWGWDGGWDWSSVDGLTNVSNLPIVFAAACDSSQFKGNVPYHPYLAVDNQIHTYSDNDDAGTTTDDVSPNTQIPFPYTPIEPSIYDDPSTPLYPMSAHALLATNGGAIAYFGDAQVTQDGKPAELGGYMLAAYGAGATVLGDIYVGAQRTYWAHQRTTTDVFASPRMDLNMLRFSGDPSLRLATVVGIPPIPSVSALSPSSGPRDGGTVVQVDGSGFDVSNTRVFFGDQASPFVACPSATTCFATAPAGTTGPVNVSVLSASASASAPNGSASTFTYLATPPTAPTCSATTAACGVATVTCSTNPDYLSYQVQSYDGSWGPSTPFSNPQVLAHLTSAAPFTLRVCAANILGTACSAPVTFDPDLTGLLTSCAGVDGTTVCGTMPDHCGGTLDCGPCKVVTKCDGASRPATKCGAGWHCCGDDGWTCGVCQ